MTGSRSPASALFRGPFTFEVYCLAAFSRSMQNSVELLTGQAKIDADLLLWFFIYVKAQDQFSVPRYEFFHYVAKLVDLRRHLQFFQRVWRGVRHLVGVSQIFAGPSPDYSHLFNGVIPGHGCDE